MTQEEKARAYDIIIQRVTKLYETGATLTKEQMEFLFPELHDNENERIRQKLLKCCDSPTFEIQTGIKNGVLKSWLEKQKEQKSIWSEEDDATIKSAVHWLEKYLSTIRAKDVSSATQDGILTVKTTITNLKSLPSSWKPSKELMKALGSSIVFHKDDPFVEKLWELYNQLQKL